MSLQEQIRNIIFYYIKTNYKNYLKEHNLKYIENDKIKGIITKMYVDKKKDLQLFIKTCLKEMMNDNYPKLIVENIIFDIFQDQELAVNRVTLEIQKYQECMINNTKCKEFTLEFPIDIKYGIGLKIDFLEDDVIVKNFKRTSEGEMLPAEKSKEISIGDSLIKVNNTDILNLSIEDKIKIIKEAIKEKTITLKFRTFITLIE